MMILVSREIAELRKRLEQIAVQGLTLTVLEQREYAQRLRHIESLAANHEEELRFFRLEEAQRKGRQCVEKLATDAMGNMMLETGKVVRPDFGKGNK